MSDSPEAGPRGRDPTRGARAAAEAARNRDTLGAWTWFARHRARTTAALLAVGPGPDARLVVVGAGNANDLDLPALLARFATVALVDLDAAALAAAVVRQGVAGHPGLTLHGGVDLSGQLGRLDAWARRAPGPDELEAFLAAPPAVVPGGPYDVVASTCLLTQLVAAVPDALGGDHPRAHEAALAERRRHLEQLLEATAPGGVALLVTDVVSSDTAPALLARADDDELDALLEATVRARNVFVGANPFAIEHELAARPRVAGVRRLPPWGWRLGATRAYLVAALEARVEGPTARPAPVRRQAELR